MAPRPDPSAVVPTALGDFRSRRAMATAGLGDPGVPVGHGPAPVDTLALHGYFVAAAESDPLGGPFHRTVASVLSRADRVPARQSQEWHRFLGLIARHRHSRRAALHCGVLANLVGVAVFGDDTDLRSVSELADLLGLDRLAAVQHRAARFVEPDPSFPITTAALRRMVESGSHPDADGVLESAVALLLQGVDPDDHLPVIRSEAELAGVVDGGSVIEWRHHLALIAGSPWSPYSLHLVELAHRSGRPEVAEFVDRLTATCRARIKESERAAVAEEVRRLVTDSGTNQRQFARWIGTSSSRLSSYIYGSVTPSASMMLRMARVSRLLRERNTSATAPPRLSVV